MRGGLTSDYLHRALDPHDRKKSVQAAMERLSEVPGLEAIAVRGFSGTIVGSIVAHEMGLPMFIVRKPKEDEPHHSDAAVEGPLHWSPLARYVIVDDFVASGNTLRAIVRGVGNRGHLLGAYLYRDDEFFTREEIDANWVQSTLPPSYKSRRTGYAAPAIPKSKPRSEGLTAW